MPEPIRWHRQHDGGGGDQRRGGEIHVRSGVDTVIKLRVWLLPAYPVVWVVLTCILARPVQVLAEVVVSLSARARTEPA